MVKKNLLAPLAFFASLFAFCVIGLGAFTRLIDAGLGCPDWPGCYGRWIVSTGAIPFVAYKAWAEMIHRYFVSGLSFFILSIMILILSQKKYRTHSNLIFITILFFLLIYQILLGQWTVTLQLMPIIVTQHLLGGFFILAIVWLIYLNNKKPVLSTAINEKKSLLFFASLGLVILVCQITLGAWTSTHYAALSCPDFPFCTSHTFFPMHFKEAFTVSSQPGINYEGGILSITTRQTIQMTHRLGAMILTLYLLFFFVMATIKLKQSMELMKPLHSMMGLLLVQLCLGMTMVLFKLPLAVAISHNLIAAALLLSLVTFIYQLGHAS